MAIVPVIIKHGPKKYDIDLDTSESVETLKSQLFSLTNVEPERQKILVKGKQVKDDTDLNSFKIKPKTLIMLMGTTGEIPKKPVEKPMFIEDMSERQLAQFTKTPSGLINLGNTCYMNSTLQALKRVPELQDRLKNIQPSSGASTQSVKLVTALGDLYKGMSDSTDPFYPMAFLTTLRSIFPQFGERTSEGVYKQQDAEEVWLQLMSQLRVTLGDSFANKYFGGKMKVTMTCDENPEEEPVVSSEDFLKLDCHISIGTNFMRDGLLAAMTEHLEKMSPSLGRNAKYTQKKAITRLPKYLTIHFVRFYWRRDVQKKSKILRKVGFPFEFDSTEFLAPETKERVIPVREKFRELSRLEEEKERALKKARFNQLGSAEDNNNNNDKEKNEKLSKEKSEITNLLESATSQDEGSNPSGLYELVALVTHQGASADSGHYQCFARQEPAEAGLGYDEGQFGKRPERLWWRFNDEKISTVDDSRIESMAGGGESDSALILLYRAKGL